MRGAGSREQENRESVISKTVISKTVTGKSESQKIGLRHSAFSRSASAFQLYSLQNFRFSVAAAGS
ncbi:MAG: hypothetical protein D6719_03625 [Candidatus Dadabacteria bacterium]|nr:MAG: hypothetical protein D6719_03625 [Candidatus Dadabacteria bacterium]